MCVCDDGKLLYYYCEREDWCLYAVISSTGTLYAVRVGRLVLICRVLKSVLFWGNTESACVMFLNGEGVEVGQITVLLLFLEEF